MAGSASNSEFAARTWLAFTFDAQCRRTQSSVQFDPFPDAARQLFDASLSDRYGFDIAAAILCSPVIGPSDLREVVCDIAALKLPYKLASLLLPQTRALWNAREPGE